MHMDHHTVLFHWYRIPTFTCTRTVSVLPRSTLSLIPNTDVHMHTDSQRSTTQYSFINTEYRRRSHAHGQSAFYRAALIHWYRIPTTFTCTRTVSVLPRSTLSLIPNTDDVHTHTDSQRSTTQYSFINTDRNFFQVLLSVQLCALWPRCTYSVKFAINHCKSTTNQSCFSVQLKAISWITRNSLWSF